MALDKEFWIEALYDIHGLTFGPNDEFDWRLWAQGVLRKAQDRVSQHIPLDSTPEAEDEAIFESIRRELAPPDHWSEELCLDRLWHMLREDEVQVDDAFQEKVFFLLYRLVERRPA